MAHITRTERFNYKNLARIINLFDRLMPHLSSTDAKKMKMACEKYLSKSRNGQLYVEYEPSRNKPPGVGRLYASGGVGLQFLSKRIRHTIAGEYYWDVDMKDAHPSILTQFCKKNDIPCANLKDYVENREAKLESLMKSLNMKREEAKTFVLRFVNSTGRAVKDCPSWFKELAKELNTIRKEVVKTTPDMEQYADKSKGNEQGSHMNLLLCTIENKCLMNLVDFFEQKGYKASVLVFDGCMVEKEDGKVITDELLQEAQQYVFERTGYNLGLAIKPMNQGFTHEELNGKDGDEEELNDLARLILTNPVGDYSFAEVASIMGEGKFVRGESGWYCWDEGTGRWVRDTITVLLGRFISKEVRQAYVKALQAYDKAHPAVVADIVIPDEKALRASPDQLLSKIRKDHIISEMTKQPGMYDPKFEDKLNDDPYLIAFNNGVWDAHNMLFRPLEKEDYITYTTGYDFNPDVSTHKVKSLLQELFKDEGTLTSLLEAFAVSMFGGNREEIFLLLVGGGRNGKGLVLDMLKLAYGEDYVGYIDSSYYTTYQKHSEGGTPMLMQLKGKRLGITDETSEDEKFITKIMKRDTGGAMVGGRALFSNDVKVFRRQYTPLISTQYPPVWTDVDTGLMKRAVNIVFPYFFGKVGDDEFDQNNKMHKLADLTLKDKIKDDITYRQAFVKLLIEQYIEYKKRGYLNLCDGVKATTKEYVANLSPALQWANENLKKDDNTMTALRVAFRKFVEHTGGMCISQKKFTSLLSKRFEVRREFVDGMLQSALIGWDILEKDD
eukprot:jgi/Botrbrau1/12704/Bobra.67_1s0067.1